MGIITDIEERRQEVYRAEEAAGIHSLRPLATPHDAQALVNYILRQRFWKKYSVVRKCQVSYTPDWERESGCNWDEDEPIRAEMELTIGNLSEGIVYHEMSHLAKGDRDNGHRVAFLRLHFALIQDTGGPAKAIHLPRYAAELKARNLVTGREEWLRPSLLAWDLQCKQWAEWLKPHLAE